MMSLRKSERDAIYHVMHDLVIAVEYVTDPRGLQGRQHLLSDILTIAVIGSICGCDDAETLEDWAIREDEWLNDFLELPVGIPSQDTFLRVLAAVDEREFRTAFGAWARKAFSQAFSAGQIAIDGKVARRSGDKKFEKSAVHMVSALACEYDLVVAQQPTDKKSNEITAIDTLLGLIHLKGSLITIDAMGCQRSIAKKIVDGEGDYLFGLKGNQSRLREEVQEVFEASLEPRTCRADGEYLPNVDTFEHVDAGHGRIETRTVHVLHDWGNWVREDVKWADLSTLICVDAQREHETTGVIEKNRRFYISNRTLSAKQAHEHVRAHWKIENGLHYVLDVTFGEDSYRARKRNAANNFIVIRHFAVNMLRSVKERKYSLNRTRRLCNYFPEYREKVLADVF